MNYNTEWVLEQIENDEKVKYLFFWGHQPSKDGSITASCFSQWWDGHPFKEDGINYPTAEHYMMAGKARLFGDQDVLAQIIATESAPLAKKLGRMVANFDSALWAKHNTEIVAQGNLLKFSQYPELKEFLLNTGNRIIVEASPRDRIWGIGMGKNNENAENPAKWRGKNLLGFCLMEVRDKLRE